MMGRKLELISSQHNQMLDYQRVLATVFSM